MRWIIGISVAIALSALILYTSRYWLFDWWERDGLLGIELLRPQGDILARQLRGSMAAPFALILWGLGAFAVLSVLEWLRAKLFERKQD